MEKYINFLSKQALFENIKETEIISLLKCLNARTETSLKDSYIRMEGDSADFIGIILEGMVQIHRNDIYGNRNIIASLEKGNLFAEAFSCAGIDFLPVDIYAVCNVTYIIINKESIFRQCKNLCSFHNQIITNLIKIIAQKNVILNQKIHILSGKTTREKIMYYLKMEAQDKKSKEFYIPFNRQELADYLGVERSAMSAELGRLKKAGIIETEKSYFKLLQQM